jgi:hypothetical protein
LQKRPSLQGASFAGCVHTPVPSQRSSVQLLPSPVHGVPRGEKQVWAASLQLLAHSPAPAHGFPACTLQVPPLQVSGPLQKKPSVHGSLLFVWTQVPLPSHSSVVHGFPSLVHGVPAGSEHVSAQALSGASAKKSATIRMPDGSRGGIGRLAAWWVMPTSVLGSRC